MPSLDIRQAVPAEAHLAIAILAEASRWLQSRRLPTWSAESLPAVIEPAVSRGEVYLAWLPDWPEPVATVSLQWSDPDFWGERPDDAGYIHKLASVRAISGYHIGAQVLRWAEDQIVARARPFARLDTSADNPAINHYYLNAGYQICGQILRRNILFNLYEKPLS